MIRVWWIGLWCCVAACVVVPTANGQEQDTADTAWIQRGEASIRKYRQADIEVLVLNAEGLIVPDAEVRVQQTRHAFPVGWVLQDGFPAEFQPDAEVWRVFNAVSLDKLTGWRSLQPQNEQTISTTRVDAALVAAEAWGMGVHWGSMLSADGFDLPEWVVPLDRDALFEASQLLAERITFAYGPRLRSLDLCEGTLEHDRYSPAMLRLLAWHARAASPDVALRLAFSGGLTGSQAFDVAAAMDAAAAEQLPIDGVSLSERFLAGPVDRSAVEQSLRRLVKFGGSITLNSLEVGGRHAEESAANLETVMRTLFAEPAVSGVYFAGLGPEDFGDAEAALMDATGQPTAAGQILDDLFRKTWWTDQTLRTDDLGKARARVFLGTHRITATLPNGQTVTAPLRIDQRNAKGRQTLILMPISQATPAANNDNDEQRLRPALDGPGIIIDNAE